MSLNRFLSMLFIAVALVGCQAVTISSADVAPPASAPSSIVHDPELIERGAKVFKYRCAACHSLDTSKSQFFGPHLANLIDRPLGQVEGYQFPEYLNDYNHIVWDEATLAQWIETPQQMIPDMCMPYMGLPNPADREALLTYLKYGK